MTIHRRELSIGSETLSFETGKLAKQADGSVIALMVMAVAAAEVAVGLAIVISVFRNRKTVDTGDLDTLKG